MHVIGFFFGILSFRFLSGSVSKYLYIEEAETKWTICFHSYTTKSVSSLTYGLLKLILHHEITNIIYLGWILDSKYMSKSFHWKKTKTKTLKQLVYFFIIISIIRYIIKHMFKKNNVHVWMLVSLFVKCFNSSNLWYKY